MTSLEDQLIKARMEISADTISMSISELTNLYREKILVIRPEFQRLYRWDVEQKSRLIESVLLGIPLPSIFVAQSSSGEWELVDGLQRVSSLLELQGILPDTDGVILPELELSGTKYLSALEGHSWSGQNGTGSLTDAQRLDIRLARLDIRVIKRDSDRKAKFDLFQRLNSFGSVLTAQEIRSAMIAGTNSACLAWLNRMASRTSFQASVALPDRLIEEQYDLELVLRFLMLHNRRILGSSGLKDFAARLNDWAVDLAIDFDSRMPELERVFSVTFDSLLERGSEDVFKKWNAQKRKFSGGFLNTSFEVIALGAGYQIANHKNYRQDVVEASKTLWSPGMLSAGFATGISTGDRFAKTVPLGRKLMANPPEPITKSDFM